jgi:hypothetical protein
MQSRFVADPHLTPLTKDGWLHVIETMLNLKLLRVVSGRNKRLSQWLFLVGTSSTDLASHATNSKQVRQDVLLLNLRVLLLSGV